MKEWNGRFDYMMLLVVVIVAIVILVGVILAISVSAEQPPQQQKGYIIQWENEMRLYGTHPDTARMFLDAQDCATIDTAEGFEGTFVPHQVFRRFSPDYSIGWLCECTSRKKIEENGSQWWSYVIKIHKVFDTRNVAKK